MSSPQRGGGFTTDQNNVLDEMTRFTKAQNGCVFFSYVDGVTSIPEDTWLDQEGVITVTQDLMGWIPERNGYISGYGVVTDATLDATDAIKFTVYRDGVESRCRFYLSAQDNCTNLATGNAGGCRRARVFNTNPGISNTDPQNAIYPFKAQEKIAVRAVASELPGHTFPDNINKLAVYLYYEFTAETPESDKSRNYGGGATTVGGGGEGGDPGGGGGIIIGM